MPIKRITPPTAIDAYLEERIQRIERAAVYNLCKIGEQVVNAARESKSYKDQTGNLRSSVGYVVAIDGQIVQMSDFALSEKGTDRTTGSNTGQAYVRELVSRFNSGIVLVVVAGMHYAQYVSAKGYDVLDSAELLAQREVPKMLKSLKIE